MALVKCPRCELNYIQEDEGYCKICKREIKGEKPREEIEMCTACNEHPAMPGKDVCVFCYKEMQSREDENENEGAISVDVGIDPVSTMEEIVPDLGDDLDGDLSLEEMGDDEMDDEDDENE